MNNTITANHLRTAANAVEILGAQGLEVTGYRSDGRRPVLTIARKPTFTRGVCKQRTRAALASGDILVRRVFAAPFHGCQIEWSEDQDAPREVANG